MQLDRDNQILALQETNRVNNYIISSSCSSVCRQ